MRDKLWFFASGRVQTNQNYIAGLFANANAGDPDEVDVRRQPGRPGVLRDHAEGHRRPRDLAGQPAEQVLALRRQPEPGLGRHARRRLAGVRRRVPVPDAVTSSRPGGRRRSRARCSSRCATRTAARRSATSRTCRRPGTRMIPVLEQSTNFQYRGRGGDGGVSGTMGFTDQNINTVVATLSYVTGAHAFKTGFSDTWSDTQELDRLERLQSVLPVQPRRAQPDHASTARRRRARAR